MEREFRTFAHNTRDVVDHEADPIEVACDASLDEGGAIVRCTFPGSPLSSGTEYFVQVDRFEAEALLDALSRVAEDEYDDSIVSTDSLRSRLHRVVEAAAPSPTLAEGV